MLNCAIHGARDLRVADLAPEAISPTQVRMVTHLDITAGMVKQLIDLIEAM